MSDEFYFALLNPARAHAGWGCFCRKSGKCLFYSQGAQGGTEWFFEMGTGKPVYLKGDQMHWVSDPKS